ncbi:GNAT family N-acetyltransferase [Clostridium sp. OS1-26]|uniref:GNAT family N-acetyltransferase n=1 Tax=Clostridium sp. OS1-26 TaxID=3070681 RepID=UPI0027E00975|nr:GNAT family N-acetyltransferase [Clostridium sp. OS1-26]WML33589.1 GNAT family N-acetyltransferase [Clostridium sp. OS1-26]
MNRKVLESERLFLKPLSFNELLYINNNEVNRIETPIELEALPDFVKSAISKKLEKMQKVNDDVHEWYTYWLIIDKDKEKGVGFVGFKGIPNETGYSEVGYNISPNYRRKGLMTEALSTLTKWASNNPGCNGITATRVLKTNIGSNSVLNNCNFTLVSSSEESNNYVLTFEQNSYIMD